MMYVNFVTRTLTIRVLPTVEEGESGGGGGRALWENGLSSRVWDRCIL